MQILALACFGEERLKQKQEPALHNDELPLLLDLQLANEINRFVDESAVVYKLEYLFLGEFSRDECLGFKSA